MKPFYIFLAAACVFAAFMASPAEARCRGRAFGWLKGVGHRVVHPFHRHGDASGRTVSGRCANDQCPAK